ncbi:MAG: Transcriptional regulator, partial [Cryptosporangiaceae bacterium]|nr:Transcriptional regulator [Cryptosporangiaceae bacterium]
SAPPRDHTGRPGGWHRRASTGDRRLHCSTRKELVRNTHGVTAPFEVLAEPPRAVDEWLPSYRLLWESRLDDLERHLDTMPDEGEAP